MSHPIALIDSYLDGTIADADAEVLRRWLDEDPSHVARFIRASYIHRALRNTFLGEQDAQPYLTAGDAPVSEHCALADDQALPSPRAAGGRRWLRSKLAPAVRLIVQPTPLSMAVATAAMALLVTAMYFMVPPFYRAMTRGEDGDSDAYQIVAQVTAVDAPVWDARQPSPFQGAHLVAGRELELQSGLAEVTFRGGAIVALQGPCKFTVDAHDSGSLAEGKLVARVNEAARGFRIRTPAAEIVDLGTEFGVSAQRDGTAAVVVLRGVVRIDAAKSSRSVPSVTLAAGEAVEMRRIAGEVQMFRLDEKARERLVTALPPRLPAKGVNVVANSNFEFTAPGHTSGDNGQHFTSTITDVAPWANSTRGGFIATDPQAIFDFSHTYFQVQTKGTTDLYQHVTLTANRGGVLSLLAAQRNDGYNIDGRVFLELYAGNLTSFDAATPVAPEGTLAPPLGRRPQTFLQRYGPLPAGDYTVRVGGTANRGLLQAGISRVRLMVAFDEPP